MSGTILLIEDNEKNRYLTTYLLEQDGYEVVWAPDGGRGIALAQTCAPVLILLDIQLPGLDGYGVARALRGIPIVAVTSYAMVGDREKALGAGCTGYIEKPIDPETFVAELRQLGLPPPASRGTP